MTTKTISSGIPDLRDLILDPINLGDLKQCVYTRVRRATCRCHLTAAAPRVRSRPRRPFEDHARPAMTKHKHFLKNNHWFFISTASEAKNLFLTLSFCLRTSHRNCAVREKTVLFLPVSPKI